MPWLQYVQSPEIEKVIDDSSVDTDYEERGNIELEIVRP